MRFPPSFLDDIKARLPISEVVGARVRFDAKKSNAARGDYWACCPFHGEKTPSFHCEDRSGRFHCFGCGAGGDIFGFLTQLDGLSFPEAVERLAGQAGLPVPQPDPQEAKREEQRATLYDIMESAAQFYERALQENTAEAAAARAYLRERGLTPAAQKPFRLGFAPGGKNALRQFFTREKIAEDLQRQSGLIAATEQGGDVYDRFRGRVMFPIADIRGKIIAFGGRALSPGARAKYLNSPETELFHKGQVLYNLAQARQAMRGINGAADKPLLVVEGYMDVAALAQAGIGEAVAPLGTALTEAQLALLWRLCPEPILCFDGDKAGLAAAFRALDRALPLLSAGHSLRFALLPEGQDPDDLVRSQGRAAFLQIAAEALPPAELLWRRETEGQGSFAAPESRAALEKRLFQAAAAIQDKSLRVYYQRDIKDRLWNYFRSLGAAARQKNSAGGVKSGGFQAGGAYGAGAAAAYGGSLITESLAHSSLVRFSAARNGAYAPREAAILAILTAHPALWHEDFDGLAELEFTAPDLQRFYRAALDILAEFAEAPPETESAAESEDNAAARLAARLAAAGLAPLLAKLRAFAAGLGIKAAQSGAPLPEAREALRQALTLHRRAHSLNKEIKELAADMREDSEAGGFIRLKALREELSRADNLEAAADE